MFSKPTKSAPPSAKVETPSFAAEPPRKNPQVASLIAGDMVVEGGLSGDVELHIDGVVRGDVRVARLSIGETGSVEGSVQAESIDCRGRVIGSITAQQVRLYGAAHVDGDITHDQLTMETGAYFQGRSLKLQRPQSIAAPLELTNVVAAE
jgi:cytoskeletal protein CcmA (bactofilin family)